MAAAAHWGGALSDLNQPFSRYYKYMVVTADRGLLVHCTPRGDIYLQANIARPQPQPQLLRDQCVGQHTANGSAVQKSMNAKANSPNRKATIEEGEAFSAMNSCAPRAADCQRQLDKSATDRQQSEMSGPSQSHHNDYSNI